MSNSIYQAGVNSALEWAGAQKVEGLRSFLMEEPEVPLIAVGSGASLSVANYATLLYGTRSAMGRSLTPLSVNSLSDNALLRCKVLLVSASGHNKDIVFLSDRLHSLKHPRVANLSIKDSENNKLKAKVSAASLFNYTSEFPSEFVEFESVVAQYALLCRAFGGKLPSQDLQQPYYYCRKDGGNEVLPMSRVQHLVVVYADYAEPVALDLESKMVESGLVSVQLCDYRNFCHGRFAFVSNHIGLKTDYMFQADTAVMILSSNYTKSVATRLRSILPDWCMVFSVTTEHMGPAASLDLLIKSNLLYIDFALEKGLRKPFDPPCMTINKRYPQSAVSFRNDLKTQGPLNTKY